MRKVHFAVAVIGTATVLLGHTQSVPVGALPLSDWSTPVNLGPTVNSGFNDNGPALSKDGLSLYFSSNRPGYGDFDIWVSHRDSTSAPWGTPVSLGPIINTSAYEAVPSLSRDGHWLLFHSTRPGGYGGWDIWMSWRAHVHDDFGWQPPVNLGPFVNTGAQDSGARLVQGESQVLLYFNSNRPGGLGNTDIYVSELSGDGAFGPAIPVVELNSPALDNRPAIRFDGLELFMFSDRPGTLGGPDLWTSTRPTVFDAWSTPVNLGGTVNTSATDFLPEISSDRLALYFASDRPGTLGGQDLYVSSRTRAR